MGLGGLAAWDQDPNAGGLFILGGLASGGVLGYTIGHRADQALARGDVLLSPHRNAARLGTVLTGATTGAIIAGIIIKLRDFSSLGSDETIFTTYVVAGSALGAIVQVVHDSSLHPADTHIEFRISPEGLVTCRFNYQF